MSEEVITTAVQIHPDTFVHFQSNLTGHITFDEGCVVHPLAKINAGTGSIVFGKFNIVEERAEITNCIPGHTLIIGDENMFEVGSRCNATKIGDRNVLGQRCVVGENVILTDGCVIGAKCEVLEHGELPKQTAVYGAENNRRVTGSLPQSLQLHTQFLRQKLPKFGYAYKRTS
ncbi:Dynactin subunit 6 [Aphelenchoides besseyi]|nr:Dynactin subunit 6 [Aphelenchoides besseyi]KAI6207821.1 Dynactin subunit 6 [Aphelenchoides besseyi]